MVGVAVQDFRRERPQPRIAELVAMPLTDRVEHLTDRELILLSVQQIENQGELIKSLQAQVDTLRKDNQFLRDIRSNFRLVGWIVATALAVSTIFIAAHQAHLL